MENTDTAHGLQKLALGVRSLIKKKLAGPGPGARHFRPRARARVAPGAIPSRRPVRGRGRLLVFVVFNNTFGGKIFPENDTLFF